MCFHMYNICSLKIMGGGGGGGGGLQTQLYTAKTIVCISYQKYAPCNTQSMDFIL